MGVEMEMGLGRAMGRVGIRLEGGGTMDEEMAISD